MASALRAQAFSRAAGERTTAGRSSAPPLGAPVMPRRGGCCSGSRSCVFCDVVRDAGQAGSKVLHQDESVVVIRDRRPAAQQHLLVLPRAHIPNVASLRPADVALVRHMQAVGREMLLNQQCEQQPLEWDALPERPPTVPPRLKFGFHRPPYRSVDHLHLHCFCLPHVWYRSIQYQHSLNWVTAEQVIDSLMRQPS